VTLKIEKTLVEHGTTIKLIGRIRAEHLSELKAQIFASVSKVVLELGEVSLVDSDAVGSLVSASQRAFNC
jgi:anti-anti-sigma regulatory factor